MSPEPLMFPGFRLVVKPQQRKNWRYVESVVRTLGSVSPREKSTGPL